MLQIFAQKGTQHIAKNGNHGKPQSAQNWTKHIAEKRHKNTLQTTMPYMEITSSVIF